MKINGERRAARVEEMETQSELITDVRREALEQLAAAIRHEINNPLTGILSYAELLLEETLPEDVRTSLLTIRQLSLRIRDIVKRLEHVKDRVTTYIGEIKMIDMGYERLAPAVSCPISESDAQRGAWGVSG